MTKYLVTASFLLLTVLGSTIAIAQTGATSPMWAFGANVGYALPMGDFKDAYNGGLTLGASGCYMFTDKYGLEITAEWSKFPANDDLVSALETISGGSADANFQFLPVTVDFLEYFPMNAPIVPYLKGGLGIYFETAEVEIGGEKDTRSENDFGFNLGGGAKIPVTKTMAIDAGLRFHNVMTEDKSTQYFTFCAGVGFMF